MEEVLYLDNAATTFPKPEAVYQAMDKANRDYAVNAGRGAYALAAKAEDIISETREQLKRLAGADEVAEVVFTASATLACNQIFGGLDWGKIATVYVSPFEHNATARSLHHYQKQYGFCIQELAMKEDALELDTEKIRYQFTGKTGSGRTFPCEQCHRLHSSNRRDCVRCKKISGDCSDRWCAGTWSCPAVTAELSG